MTLELPTVLHIHFWADIRNSAGSVEKVISAFAANGQRYRHLIACCPGDPSVKYVFEHHGIRVYPFHESRLINRVANKLLGLKAFSYPDLVRLINQIRPDIVHFHNRQELVDAVVSRLDYRPAVLVHYHRHFAAPIRPALADRLVFISRRTADDILGKLGLVVDYDIVFNPLSLEVLERAHATGMPVPTLGQLPVILFGGGGNPIKGGKELIEAFQRLPGGVARLVLAGRNVEKLSGLPHPGIEVIGEIPARDFFARMQSADIVAMPSYDEPFGLIAQEAMLLDKLLVVANCGGLTEFTGPDCAVVIDPHDIDALVAGLREALTLIASPIGLANRLLRARERVNEFQPCKVVGDLERVYDAVHSQSVKYA